MSFTMISIIAYALSGGAVLIDKILLKKSLPNPIAYAFYLNLLGLVAVVFVVFGITFNYTATFLAIASGILSVFSFLTFFKSLKTGEASVVGPVVGSLNPLFALLLGVVFFHQYLTGTQTIGFFVTLFGGAILTFNLWSKQLNSVKQIGWMVAAGLFFALSYGLLRESFIASDFITGLVISRAAAGIFVLLFLIHPYLRAKVFEKNTNKNSYSGKKTAILLILGQVMGAMSGFLINFAISFANPALVNSFFGIQYFVILLVSLLLFKKHPQLLDETLTRRAIIEKVIGAIVITIGLVFIAQ